MAKKTAIGAYGEWAAGLAEDPPALSFRRDEFKSIAPWRKKALAKTTELIAPPPEPPLARPRVVARNEFDGLEAEVLSWRLPWGPPAEAVFLKPAGAKGKLPGMLALHDHGGFKYYGWRKIADASPEVHPLVVEHRERAYGGVAWANELAKRGWAVLCNDVFAFGSRRVRCADVTEQIAGGRKDPAEADSQGIRAYNQWCGGHEHIMAKSLFSAGTTWPGVVWREDQAALRYLLSRPEVDASKVACGGLSGGGLRTVYLAGLDHRVKACVTVGFMSTWRDFLLEKCRNHTWMVYTPRLPNFLDFPDLLSVRAPLPSLVQSCTEDPLYTVPEMKRADRILKAVYEKAGAPDAYRTEFYPGGHKFDLEMQQVAFEWLEERLRI